MKQFRYKLSGAALALSLSLACSPAAYPQVNLPVLGDSLSGTISQQQEFEFGREFLRQVRRESPLLNDPLMQEYIISLTHTLAAHSELTDHRLAFVLIDSEQLNAFAAPGGIVGVNAGLFLFTQNEGQLASVLAHELAHISQRHYARSVQQARNSTIPNMAGLLASLVIMATAGGEAGQAALAANQALGVDSQLRFSRSHEQEADRIGLRTLYNAGFDPDDMAGMFEQMLRSRNLSQRPPEFLLTHPLDESRIADSKNRAHGYPEVDYSQNSEFLLMRQRALLHFSSNLDADIEIRRRELPHLEGAQADATRYGLALAELRSGQFVNSAETLDALLEKEPSRITYVMLSAEIALAAKQYDRALTILDENLQINPGNHPLTMAYADALNQAGRHEEAARVLDRHSNDYPNDPQLWQELAEAEGQAGNITAVHIARAEYLISLGDFGRARDQLNYALNLEKDRLTIARIRQRQDYIREIQNKFYR